MDMFNGYRIETNPLLQDVKTTTVERSFKERWFSWPWRPWKITKTVTTYKPSTDDLPLDDW